MIVIKEVRSKENAGTGKKLEKTISLADRMKSNISHSVEQHKEQSSAESSPNQYADSTAREGFDRITHEGGHLVISSSQDAYHMGVNLYKRHQAQKQAESQRAYATTETPAVDSSVILDEPLVNTSEVSPYYDVPTSPSTSDAVAPMPSSDYLFPTGQNYPRTREEFPVELPTQSASFEAGKQYAQRSTQESLRSVRGKTESVPIRTTSEIQTREPQDHSLNIRTRDTVEWTDDVAHNPKGKDAEHTPIEAGRTLAKEEAYKRSARNKVPSASSSSHAIEGTPLELAEQPTNFDAGVTLAQRNSRGYENQSISIRTKETVEMGNTVLRSPGGDSNAQSSVEAGRALAKKEAHKQSIERQKQAAHISVSTEIEIPKQTEQSPVNSGVGKLEPVKKSEVELLKDSDREKSTAIDAISSKEARARGKASQRVSSKVARGKMVKEVGYSVRSAEHSVKGTDIATKEMIRVAKNNLTKAKRAEQIRLAAQAAASAAKKAGNLLSKAARAIAESVKELITALAAGGGMALLVVVILVVVGAAGLMLASDENDGEVIPVSDEVKAYEPLIRQYAKQYGIGDYVLLIEAVMMQESGGRTTDPMQCSECNFNTRYPHAPGSITDPEYSIEVGIQNLADCLSIAGAEGPLDIDHIKLAIQGYNYGQGYITWALNKYGEYSKANAVEFSMKTAEQVGWNSYGDMDYVPHVLRYYPLGQLFYDPDGSSSIVEVAYSQIGNVGGDPYWSWYGFSNHVEWCACFVSWCADQCGYLNAGVIPKFSSCVLGINWFKERGQWQSNTYEPAPGDLIFFDWNKAGVGQDGISDHVGIVQKVENGRVYTIEGNSGDMCKERSYTIGNYQIIGYGVPAY